MLYNRNDVNLEAGRNFMFGFIVAGGIVAFLWLALGVSAQIEVPAYKAGAFFPAEESIAVNVDTASGTAVVLEKLDRSLMTNDQLQAVAHEQDLKIKSEQILSSKYAKLYDSCKNK